MATNQQRVAALNSHVATIIAPMITAFGNLLASAHDNYTSGWGSGGEAAAIALIESTSEKLSRHADWIETVANDFGTTNDFVGPPIDE
jgi:hypothetical protein